MKVVYVFLSSGAGLHHLVHKIVPQLEMGTHGSQVVGLCFFDENASILEGNNPFGVKLAQIAEKENIVLMIAQSSDMLPKEKYNSTTNDDFNSRPLIKPSECTVITVSDGEHIGCFPDLYAALNFNRPDHIITF